MRYTPEDRVAASRLFLFIDEKWRVRGIRDANLRQVGWHILISQFEGKKTNPHGISLALDKPYETVRQRPTPCNHYGVDPKRPHITDRNQPPILATFVTCRGDERGKYGRLIAVCNVGPLRINAIMVARGWALAYRHYSNEYVPYEDDARLHKRGLWRGQFVAPWEWRRGKR